jgi:hypothetical protein
MKRALIVVTVVALLLLAGLAWQVSTARGEAADTYELVKSNIGPAGAGSSGVYEMSSTAGQPDAGEFDAGSYSLGGGFWGGGEIVSILLRLLYTPIVIR